MVQLLLGRGADPNCRADELATTIYTEKPLTLARQARFLMNWDQYQPIVQLLDRFAATDEDGSVESQEAFEQSKAEAKKWQSALPQSSDLQEAQL